MTKVLTRQGKLKQVERNGATISHDLDNSNYKNGSLKEGKTDDVYRYSTLLREDQIPQAFRTEFLVSRYRPRNLTVLDSVKSVFYANNETVNFWSHFLSSVILIARYCSVVWNHNPSTHHFYFPLASFTLGCCTMYTMSCVAHMFSSMTELQTHVGYYLDYAAISVYTFTAGQAFYFYCHPLGSGLLLYDWRELFLFVSALISFSATFNCCKSRHQWLNLRFIVRTGFYILCWMHNCSPYFVRLFVCSSDPACNPDSIRLFAGCLLSFTAAAVVNVTRVPERFVPGFFDFIGQSHNFLHILTTIGDHFAFSVFLSDLAARKEFLIPEHIPNFFETIGLSLLVLAGNLAIVFWFARSLFSNSSGKIGHDKSA